MHLSLRHLRLVDAVRREGTLTRAAGRLFLTQSALSHQLADLERRVGTPIFHRVGKRMVPTPAGLRLVESAGAVLRELRSVEGDLGRMARGETGLIRLTTQCYTCYHWLPTVLPTFRERHATVEVRLVPDATSRAPEALLDGEVDLVVGYDVPDDARLCGARLFDDELVLLVARDHPYAERAHVEASDFASEHLLVYRNAPAESLFFRSVLQPGGVEPRRVSEVRLTEGIVALVAAGEGVAVLTRWTVAPELRAGTVVAVRVTPSGLRREWRAVTLHGDDRPAYLDDFIALLRRGPDRLFDGRKRRADRSCAGIVVPDDVAAAG